MPRSIDPSSLSPGKGRAPDGTVEDSSLRYPQRDTDPLRVHVHDPVRAHMASTIGIVDAGNCYVSDEVEGALQELCGMSTGAGRLNGLISGGTFVETFPHAGLTLTLVDPTEIMNDGALFQAGGLTITLPNSDDTYYIYFDEDSASPTYQTLQAQTGAPPEIETPGGIENVMIAKVVVSGGGTTIDDYQDARFFVRNLDRKVEYTSVQGEDVDAWSEACFVTLDACMFWLEHYGSSASSEEQKGTILIRGTHNLNSTLTIPIDHVEFVGDGDAILSWKASAGTMVDISGRNDVSFRNIKFETAITYDPAMYGVRATGNPVNKITFDDCTFQGTSNTNYFHGAISLATNGAANCNGIVVRDCVVGGVTGIEIDAPKDSLIIGTMCGGTGVSAAGINFTSTAGPAPVDTVITSTNIDNFNIGVQAVQASNVKITACTIYNASTGILIDNDASRDVIISDTLVQLEDSTGMIGIQLYGERHSVSNCDIWNLRTTSAYNPGDEPTGIDVPTGMLISVSDTRIRNFINTQTPGASLGYSINFQGMGGSQWESCTVSNCVLEDNGIEATQNSVRLQISNCDIKGHFNIAGGVSSRPLIKIGNGAKATSIVGNTLDCNEVATHGIHFAGGDNYGNNILVDANQIVAFPDYGILFDNRWRDWTISNNKLDGFLNTEAGTAACISGEGIRITAASNMVPHEGAISNNNVTRCVEGIVVHGFNITPVTLGSALIDTVSITGNRINYCARLTAATDVDPLVVWNTGGGLPPGACGIAVGNARNIVIANNQISSLGVVLDSGVVKLLDAASAAQSTGIFVRNVGSLSVQNNKVSDIFATDGGDPSLFVFARPIRIEAAFAMVGNGGTYTMENVQVTGNVCIGTGATPAYGEALTDTGIGFLSSNIADDAAATYGILRANVSGNMVTKMSLNAAHAALIPTTPNLWHTSPAQGIALFQEGVGACKEVQFTDNTIYDIDGYGLRTYGHAMVSYDAELANITISSNQMNQVGSPLFDSAGIYCSLGDGSAGYGLNILGNAIGTAVTYGVRVVVKGTTPLAGSKALNLNVQGNSIQRVDDGLIAFRRGIAIRGESDAALIQHVNVQGNVVGAQLSGVDSATVDVGIDVFNQETDSWKDIVIVDNKIISGNQDRDNYAIRVEANPTAAALSPSVQTMTGVTIRNNTSLIHADHTGGSYGMYVSSDGYLWDGLRIDHNVVRYEVSAANDFQTGVDCKLSMTVVPTNDIHRKLSLEGNDITSTDTNGKSVPDLRAVFYGNVGVDELSVCGNKTRNHIMVVYDNTPALAGSLGIENWDISNNQINNVSEDTTPLLNCKLANVQTNSFKCNNVRICGNQLNTVPNAGVFSQGIYALFDRPGGDVFQVRNLEVAGNQVNDVDHAIYIDAQNAHLSSVGVVNNNITNWGSDGGGAAGGNAVQIKAGGFADAINVSNNSISAGDMTANGAAIHYRHIGQQRTAGLQIDNNTISQAGGQAVMVALGATGNVSNQPDRAISVSGNMITQCSMGASNPVVFIMPDGTNVNPGKIISYQVSNNTLSYCGPDDIPTDYIKVDVQLYDFAYGGVVSDNVLVGGVQGILSTKHIPRDGILVSIPDTGGTVGGRALSVTGNSISGLEVTSYCGIEINCEGETHGLTVDTNTVHGYPPQGNIKVKVEDADLLAASISGNVVTVPPAQDGTYGIRLEQVSATASRVWRGIGVNGNTIEGIDGDSGIYVDAKDCKLKDFNCNGNQLWQPGVYGIWVTQGGGFAGSGDYEQELVGFSCSDNQVVMDSGGSALSQCGIKVDMLLLSGAGPVGTSVYATNGRVSNNSVVFDNGTHSAAATGIHIELFGSSNYTSDMSARVWDVSNNIIRDFRQTGLMVNINPFAPVNAGPTCYMSGWGISNNIIRSKTDDPLYITGSLGALYLRTEGCTHIHHSNVTNNQVNISGSDPCPVTFSAFCWYFWTNVQLTADQICHNSVTVPIATALDQTVVVIGAPTFTTTSGVCADNFTNRQSGGGTGFTSTPWTGMNNHDNFTV